MSQPEPPAFFDKQHASAYNQQYAKLAPLRDAIHLLIRVILGTQSAEARILCIGAGTGEELIFLAQEFPQWQFTVVEPSAPMLDICRQRVEENGIAPRCTFHAGYLDTLPASEPFDVATALLVSHFIRPAAAQREFFTQIAARLRLDGTFICSAIASDTSTEKYQSLLDVWMQMQRYTGTPEEAIAKIPANYDQHIAVLPPAEIEAMIAASGFGTPTLFYQTLLIHAWYAQTASAADANVLSPKT